MKLVWLSDIHLKPSGERFFGVDTVGRLQHAVNYIAQQHSDADYCLLSGDLAEDGDSDSYQAINDITAGLPMPVLSVPGNHDNRNLMRQYFKYPENIDDEFIQFSVTKRGFRVIALDTLHDGHAEGLICDKRLGWLEHELAGDRQTPTIVFCHHHPAELHLPMQDNELLLNGDALLGLLCDAPNVRHLFFGHVHRPVSGSFGGLGFTALQSVSLQAPLPYPSWDWESFSPAAESPALGIIHASEKSIVTHFHAFCKFENHYYPASKV